MGDFAKSQLNMDLGLPSMPMVPALGVNVADIWIEGPSGDEPFLHQSINVGDPDGDYESFSFGLNGAGMLEGEVYIDSDHGGEIVDYKKTTKAQDESFLKQLRRDVGQTGVYGIDDICRTYSRRKFQNAPGSLTTPPKKRRIKH